MDQIPADQERSDIRKARWGDRDAFARLYAAHAAPVYALALRLTGEAAAAEDITQDAFLRLMRFIGGVREDAPLRPWLKRVVANLAIDRLRHQRVAAAVALDEEWPDAAPSEGARLEAEELLRRLPPLARTLLWLHEMEGWSHQELARHFGRSESWSKSIVSRALTRLRTELEREAAHASP